MNTTTATRRNALLRQQGIKPPTRLHADRPAALPPAPAHDFLVLNQHPAFTAETAAYPAVQAIAAKAWTV
jgi:hypothetical protein